MGSMSIQFANVPAEAFALVEKLVLLFCNNPVNFPPCGLPTNPKELNIRTHSCPHCGIVIDRDLNAAINIKNRATGHFVLKARGARCNGRAAKREAYTKLAL